MNRIDVGGRRARGAIGGGGCRGRDERNGCDRRSVRVGCEPDDARAMRPGGRRWREPILAALGSAVLGLGLVSCGGASESPDDASASGEQAAATYDGPAMTLRGTVEGTATTFDWSTTVPTGGWELRFDRAASRDRSAILYTTLIRPGADAMVTQALEDLDQSYRHGRVAFADAVLMVRVVERGTDPGDGGYLEAARWRSGG